MTGKYHKALEVLRAGLRDPLVNFRDGQWEAIEALVVQRTGWGKSAV